MTILKKVRERRSHAFPNERVKEYRSRVTLDELFNIVKCVKGRQDFNECKECAYYKFCDYCLRWHVR
jgi:hypothetical protein